MAILNIDACAVENFDSQILNVLIAHLDYSFNNLKYEDLTDSEKSIVTRIAWDKYHRLKLDKSRFDKMTSDSSLIDLMISHFNYSIRDIESYDELTDQEKALISKDIFDRITITENDLFNQSIESWNKACNFTEDELDKLKLIMSKSRKDLKFKIIYDRNVMFTTDEHIDELCKSKHVKDPWELPMYGMTLRFKDNQMEKIIDDFDPEYAVSAGEDSTPQYINYIQNGELLYRFKDNHPEFENKRLMGWFPVIYKISDNILEIRQADPCANLSIYLIKNDYPLALLLGSDLGNYYRSGGGEINLVKRILTDYYHFELGESI